jgi:hypothetical protein
VRVYVIDGDAVVLVWLCMHVDVCVCVCVLLHRRREGDRAHDNICMIPHIPPSTLKHTHTHTHTHTQP